MYNGLPEKKDKMKKIIVVISMALFAIGCGEQQTSGTGEVASLNDQVVEASCGQCLFGMGEGGCDLAVRIDGKGYFVDGTGIDDHGDSHGKDGFCSVIRRAKVTGKVENDRFMVKDFELLPLDK